MQTRQRPRVVNWTSVLLLAILVFSNPLHGEDDLVSYNRDVRPILSDHCFACHGFDEKQRQADLRLDTVEGATQDLGGYRALVPADLEASLLWERINASDDSVMPPEDFHKPLEAEQVETLRRWIEQGGVYEEHWSFVTPTKPKVPALGDQVVSNPIDAFIQRQLMEEGLAPAVEAGRETLIRRVTLDLTGLPPTPEEVQAFLQDESDDAYEKLVDELQSRVTYGEHMARYWLDLARYADTHGLHLDNERSMWPYRDWVVRAINSNVSFDDFTRWQLAGDLLPEPTQDQLIASGFNRCNVTTSEGGSIQEEWIYRYAVDRTSTMAEVWMGLTAGCAVCHDHKFDPLSTKEYYSMYAFFHSAADPAMDGNKMDTPPILKIVSEEDQERVAALKSKVDAVDVELTEALLALDYEDPALQNPVPEPQRLEEVWFEDSFPEGVTPQASGGPALQLVSGEGNEVFSGETALKRVAEDVVAQDFFDKGADFVVPKDGEFFVYCYLDPADTPETIMVQFHSSGWKHRAVWGEAEKIPFGQPDTTEKKRKGDLPEAGKWVRLEFTAAEVGLKPGTQVTGYAFTQFGGTVYWDHLGVEHTVDKAKDPMWSWQVWSTQEQGKLRKDLPDHLRRKLQGRTVDRWSDEEQLEVRKFWLREKYAGASEVVAEFEKQAKPFQDEIDRIQKQAPITMVMADLPKPRDSFVMLRGAYDRPGEKVTRSVPSFLPPLISEAELPNRLDLANWLLSREHPLTARVTVNRFWQQFFGVGLVETSSDFGSQGQPPSHPELLDWLAVQFIDDGWDMKRLVRRIVTSHAYRQSSYLPAGMAARDPMNRLLARGPRLRLDAEVLRDQALFIGGLLVDKVGGPGVKPYQPPNIWEPVGFGNSNTRYYKQDSGDSLYRRSLYTFLKRTAPPPFMSSFDAPNREQCCTLRSRSNTPLQALQLMNDVQHVEAARGFAQRILSEGGSNLKDRVDWAWHVVTARPPEPSESKVARRMLKEFLERYQADEEAAQALVAVGESPVDETADAAELAAYTMLANLLLNLDECINKN